MTYPRFFIFFFLLLSTLISLFAAIDPSALSPNWWEEAESVDGQKSLNDLSKTLSATLETLSKEGQVSANEELALIQRNLDAFNQLKKTEVQPFTKTPLANRPYTIAETLELFEKQEQSRITLSTLSEERQEKSSQISSAQEKMDRLIDKYYKEKEQTEERLLLGIRWINLQVSLAAANLKLSQLDILIQNNRDAVRSLGENLQFASKNLQATPEEEKTLLEERAVAEKLWQESLQELKNREAEKIRRAAFFTNDTLASDTEFENQELLQKTLSEALAKSHLFFIDVQLNLLSSLKEEESTIALEYVRKARKELDNWKKRVREWKSASERQIQKTGAFITLMPQDSGAPQIYSKEQQIIRVAQGNLFIAQRLDTSLIEISFLLDLTEKKEAEKQGRFKWLQNEAISYASSLYTKISDITQTTLFHIGGRPISALSLLELILLLVIVAKVAALSSKGLARFLSRRKQIDRSLAYRVHRIAYYLLFGLGILIALSVVGVDLSSFLLIAGALGVGLGFGLQTIFNNFISGIILLFESHIKVGDFIEISSGLRGEVREINFRSTIVATNDGLDVIVPNSEIISGRVMNWTLKHPFRRIQVPFTTGYDVQKEHLSKILIEEAAKMEQTLIAPGFSGPMVTLTKFGESGLEFELGVWVKEKPSRLPGRTLSDYLWMIDETLKREGIPIPYTRWDIKIIPDDKDEAL